MDECNTLVNTQNKEKDCASNDKFVEKCYFYRKSL